MSKPTYIVNKVLLDDPYGRWFLEGSSSIPGSWSQEVTTAKLRGRHGSVLAAAPTLTEGSLALVVVVVGEDSAQCDAHLREFSSYVMGTIGQVEYYPDVTNNDYSKYRECTGVCESFTVEKINPTTVKVLLTFKFPNPIWQAENLATGTVYNGSGNDITGLLENSTAPLNITWIIPQGVTSMRVTDPSGDEIFVLEPGAATSSRMKVDDWASPLGSRISVYKPLNPLYGAYVFTCEANKGGIQWQTHPAYL